MAAFFSLAAAAGVSAQTEGLISVASDGTLANGNSSNSSMSSDGRYVVFRSLARNLVPETTTGLQIYLRDRSAGTTELISVNESGAAGDADSSDAKVSDNGRYAVFSSYAKNLIPGVFSYKSQIYLRDRLENKNQLISKTVNGGPATAGCIYPNISADGRYVVYTCASNNLVADDTNNLLDIFVYDRITDQTQRVSVSSDGTPGNDYSLGGAFISADGRYVVFTSKASNLVANDTNDANDVFVHDRIAGTTKLISMSSDGVQGNGESSSFGGDITPDGRLITFHSVATNLVSGDTNGSRDVFVHNQTTGVTDLVSIAPNGGQFSGAHMTNPNISDDGRYVAFTWNDTYNHIAYVRDLQTSVTTKLTFNGGAGYWPEHTYESGISSNGRYVLIHSNRPDIVAGDTNNAMDVFLVDLENSCQY